MEDKRFHDDPDDTGLDWTQLPALYVQPQTTVISNRLIHRSWSHLQRLSCSVRL